MDEIAQSMGYFVLFFGGAILTCFVAYMAIELCHKMYVRSIEKVKRDLRIKDVFEFSKEYKEWKKQREKAACNE